LACSLTLCLRPKTYEEALHKIKKYFKGIFFNVIIFYYRVLINAIAVFDTQTAAAKAISIFKIPRAGRPNKSQKLFLDAHFEGYSSSGKTKIAHYRWPGPGKKILLAHGWESNSARWTPYILGIQDLGFDIYALDAPAHGLSEGREFTPEIYADAIESIATEKKIDIIIGHSAGAYSALIYAHRNRINETVKSLVLLAPTGRIRDFIEKTFQMFKLKESVRQAYFNGFEELYKHELSYYDSDNLIKSVRQPGLLIHDKKDRTLPYADSVHIAENWPNARFITTEGFGHRLRSSIVIQHILDYLREIR